MSYLGSCLLHIYQTLRASHEPRVHTGAKSAWQHFGLGKSLLWDRFRNSCPSSTDLLKPQTMTCKKSAWQGSWSSLGVKCRSISVKAEGMQFQLINT